MSHKHFKTLINLSWFLALLYGLSFWSRAPRDPDLGWHLLGGKYVFESGDVPRTDFINAFNPSWIDYHWLGQLGMYALYHQGGWVALRFALGLVMAALFLSLLLLVKKISSENWCIIPVLIMMMIIGYSAEIRPQMLALFLLSLGLLIFYSKLGKFEFPYLLICTVLLVNIHVYWIFLPFLWFCFKCLPLIFNGTLIAKSFLPWGGFLLLCLCGFISPYGHSNYLVVLDYLRMPFELKNQINELKSTFAIGDFRSWALLTFLILLARSFRFTQLKTDPGAVVPALVATILCTLSIKYFPLLCLFSIPWILQHCQVSFAQKRVALASSIVLLFLLVATGRSIYHFPQSTDRYWELESLYPIEACRWLTEHSEPEGKAVIVATHFDHGGWCRFAILEKNPQLDIKVTTDNRTQFVEPEHFRKGFDLYFGQRDWKDTIKTWNPDYVVVKNRVALGYLLELQAGTWQKVYTDEFFTLFKRLSSVKLEQAL